MLKEVLASKPLKEEKKDAVVAGVKVQYADASEKRKLSIILNKLKNIPTGRKTLENLAEYGTIVSLEPISAWGGFSPENNRVYLNATAKNDKLCSTLVHEARHATQYMRKENKTLSRGDYDLETQIRLDRAQEADAQVFAYQAVCEWAWTGDQKPFQEFNAAYYETCNFYHFQKRDKKIKDDTDEARSVLFRAFFEESKRVASYENLYMNNEALSDFSKCISGEEVSLKKHNVHLTTDQIAAITCGEYMADYDAFLRSDKAMGVTLKTKDVLAMTFAAQGRDYGVGKLSVSTEKVGTMEANAIATSPVGGIFNASVNVLRKATGLKTRQEIEVLYNDPVEKQTETVRSFDAETREAFRRGKIAERFVRYFDNLSVIFDAGLIYRISSDEEKKAAAQKKIDEKTLENANLRDYVTVAAFVAHCRAKSPALAEKALALPELSERVKKELRFDNTVLSHPSERAPQPLTKEDEKALAVLRKSLSRAVKDNALVLQKATVAKNAGR